MVSPLFLDACGANTSLVNPLELSDVCKSFDIGMTIEDGSSSSVGIRALRRSWSVLKRIRSLGRLLREVRDYLHRAITAP